MDVSDLNLTNTVDGSVINLLKNEVDISIYHDYFRELDIDTWLILTQKFVINPAPENVSWLYSLIKLYYFKFTYFNEIYF